MTTLHFRIYSSPNSFNLSLKDVDLTTNVDSLRKKLVQFKEEITNLNLIFLGKVLKDSDILENVGVSSESLIYCTPRYEAAAPAAAPLSLMESQQLMASLRSAMSHSNFRSALKKFGSIEQIETLVSECPSLRRDPGTLAYIQDSDLLYSLLNGKFKQVDERPTLGRLLQIICTLINSELGSPHHSRHVSYSLDALSDEEMDVELNDSASSSSSRPGGSSSSFQPITPAQLAAALANASGGGSWQGASSSSAQRSGLTTPSASSTPFNTPAPNSGSRAGGASPGGQTITNEMFSQALQNALAASATRSSSSTIPQAAPTNNAAPVENLEESLQLMREMGIGDEEIATQALQATSGDVQAAVNLIFAQWMADD